MAKKNTKSRYWVDDNSILPEIVVTPQGNYPILDEAGNPARTVGAIQDINPNAHIYERVNTQPFMDDYIEGETNTAANQRADALDAQVVPHMGDFVGAATKPLDALMPSRWVGLLDKDYDGLSAVDRFSRLFDENNRGLFINDNPYGLFSKRYAEEHPYWAMAGNMAGDVLIGLGMKKTLDSSKNLYHSVIREPIPFSEKQAAAQRMNDFIHSADYIHKQKQAGLTDTEISDFQDMVARRLNSGDFPAYYSRINADGMSIALPKPIGGIYMKRGLSPEDFLNAFDHEVAHYSTVNFGKSGNPYNKLARLVNKENPTTVEKMMDYNSGIVPLRPKSDALKIRKDRGLKTDATWLNKPKSQILLDYFQNDQEIRSNACAIVQDAERRGMSVDDYIDFCTSPGGEIYRAAPTPIKYLNYVFTPENMKKFLKGFLSISAPAILTTNKTNKNVKAYGGLLDNVNLFGDGGDESKGSQLDNGLLSIGDVFTDTDTGETRKVVNYTTGLYNGIPYSAPIADNGNAYMSNLYLPEINVLGNFRSSLDWSPESWFSLRTPKPDGTLYNEEEAEKLRAHVPEYLNIEKQAKANGTWLKMPDGSTWQGDPRSWVMMQSANYKKNYLPQIWYTGQAEWPTIFDYGNGKVRTNKLTRAPYYDGQMWFSNNKSYGDAFAHFYDSNAFGNRRYKYWEKNIRGKNFLSAIPIDTYRELEAPKEGTSDSWTSMPYYMEDNTILRLPDDSIKTRFDGSFGNINSRIDERDINTDSVANWSKDFKDKGIFMHKVEDGSGVIIPSMEDFINKGEYIRTDPVIEEFISQPGHTKKVKFIEGNTGDFDINNPYKYAFNWNGDNNQINFAANGGPLKPKFWNDLSMKEKSEMIRVAVNEGITDIGEIRDRYNEYAESLV